MSRPSTTLLPRAGETAWLEEGVAADIFFTAEESINPAKIADELRAMLDGAAIDVVEKAYRVYAKKVPGQNGDYSMDHTALVYLMDKDGRFVAPFNLKRKPEEAAADLRRYM